MGISGRVRGGDAIIIAVVLVAAVIAALIPFIPRETGRTVEVRTADGQAEYSLGTPGEYRISSEGYTLILKIENGNASISSSDCKCGICTAHAPISHAGESIVCLPAGVTVRVCGKGGADGEAG